MASYTRFRWPATSISNFQTWSVKARSLGTAANLYIRVTGIAHYDTDPTWMDKGLVRGTLLIATPPVLQAADLLIEHCATAGFRQLTRDVQEHVIASEDDFGMALDEVAGLDVTGSGSLPLTLNAAFTGDVWTPDVSFTVDLLVYRTMFDGQPVSDGQVVSRQPDPRIVNVLVTDLAKFTDLLRQP